MIKAKIIADSINASSNRITTWILTYPRIIHSELMTHRMFSRNAASSRAIPVEKMLKAVLDNPALPEYWGANQKGMQAAIELDDDAKADAIQEWLHGRDRALITAKELNVCGAHKQITNRVIEPWSHITVLVTATEYDNFFGLRAHKDAQPEFQVLAYTMVREYLKSIPNKLNYDEWHIPFSELMPKNASLEQKLKIATARAARISYTNFEGEIDPVKDYDLHDRLLSAGHMSPFEHCAKAIQDNNLDTGNFVGWLPYRKTLPNENGTKVDLYKIWLNVPEWVRIAIARNDALAD